jgi:predicted RNA-binding protein YlqC (UPF0109 family)
MIAHRVPLVSIDLLFIYKHLSKNIVDKPANILIQYEITQNAVRYD